MILPEQKIVTMRSLQNIVASHRRRGRTLVFTNGCFDLLHAGHVDYLNQAKRNDRRVLIVGLNSDSSVRRLKGPSRPLVPQRQRALVVAALGCVDHVVVFSSLTPERLIRAIRPDVLVKGADWEGRPVAGAAFVRSYGGRVEFISLRHRISTTKIIETILKRHGGS